MSGESNLKVKEENALRWKVLFGWKDADGKRRQRTVRVLARIAADAEARARAKLGDTPTEAKVLAFQVRVFRLGWHKIRPL